MNHKGPDNSQFVWVTRPRPQADEHASAIAAAGFRPLISPVMTIRVLPAPDTLPVSPSGTAGLIFTSVNGLQHFPRNWLSEFRDHPVFVSGTTTQKFARDMGFHNVLCSPDQGSRGLLRLIRDTFPFSADAVPSGLFYIAGTSRTPLLEQELSADFHLTVSELYAAEFETHLSESVRQAFENRQVAAVTLFSSRSASHAAKLLQTQFRGDATPIFDELLAVCISQSVAERARNSGFTKIAIATAESAESIVNKLVEQLKIHRNSSKTI